MDKMERLNKANQAVEDMTRKKDRYSGVYETKKARVEELEKKTKEEFNCEVSEIPDLVEKLDQEAEEALGKAESMLQPSGTE